MPACVGRCRASNSGSCCCLVWQHRTCFLAYLPSAETVYTNTRLLHGILCVQDGEQYADHEGDEQQGEEVAEEPGVEGTEEPATETQ